MQDSFNNQRYLSENTKCLCNNHPLFPPHEPPNIPPFEPPNIPPPNIPIMLITSTGNINNSISNRKDNNFININNTLDNIQTNSSSIYELSNNNLATIILVLLLIVGTLFLFVFNKYLLNICENILSKNKNNVPTIKSKTKICPV